MTMMEQSYRAALIAQARREGRPDPTFEDRPAPVPLTAQDPDLDLDLAVARALKKVGKLKDHNRKELGVNRRRLRD